MFKKIVLVGGASLAILGVGTAAFASAPAATGSPTPALTAPAAHKAHAHRGHAETEAIHGQWVRQNGTKFTTRRDPQRGDRRFAHLHQREGRRWHHRKLRCRGRGEGPPQGRRQRQGRHDQRGEGRRSRRGHRNRDRPADGQAGAGPGRRHDEVTPAASNRRLKDTDGRQAPPGLPPSRPPTTGEPTIPRRASRPAGSETSRRGYSNAG